MLHHGPVAALVSLFRRGRRRFQMLLCGANAMGMGYKACVENVVFEFFCLAKEARMDIFHVFDSLAIMYFYRRGACADPRVQLRVKRTTSSTE